MIEMQLQNSRSRGSSYFIEELSNEQFISYEALSNQVGISDGILHNEGEGWLRFEMDGKELIVAKKTIRHTISWDQINNAGCVFGGKVITINGNQYKVRLLTGADHNPTQLASPFGYYVEGSHNSEWSRLFYPIIRNDTYLPVDVLNVNAPYSNQDLGMLYVNSSTLGTYSWCQETYSEDASWRVARGYQGVSRLAYSTSSNNTNAGMAWRPCLEHIPPTLLKPNHINGYVLNTSGQYLATPTHLSGFAFKETE